MKNKQNIAWKKSTGIALCFKFSANVMLHIAVICSSFPFSILVLEILCILYELNIYVQCLQKAIIICKFSLNYYICMYICTYIQWYFLLPLCFVFFLLQCRQSVSFITFYNTRKYRLRRFSKVSLRDLQQRMMKKIHKRISEKHFQTKSVLAIQANSFQFLFVFGFCKYLIIYMFFNLIIYYTSFST